MLPITHVLQARSLNAVTDRSNAQLDRTPQFNRSSAIVVDYHPAQRSIREPAPQFRSTKRMSRILHQDFELFLASSRTRRRIRDCALDMIKTRPERRDTFQRDGAATPFQQFGGQGKALI